MARDFWRQRPAHGVADVITWFRASGYFSELTDGSIAKKLKGLKRRTLLSMNTVRPIRA